MSLLLASSVGNSCAELSAATRETPDDTGAPWRATGVNYRGFPVYVSSLDGTMAYEQDFERLVSLPEAVEEAIVDILMLDDAIRNAPAAVRTRLNGRAH